ncbi:FimV/HubP family polar landmark protein [Rhodoferax ferrireducens]|uniref:FimV/HubP family polar landmark protein n=1 Tax=Rhodoferax ferrireducens TaxID=192843 RepID=UPI002FCDDDD3
MIAKSHRWHKTAMAAAAAAVFGIWGTNAAALSLGRITVQSALGEPLRAEIDVPDINAEEASSLKTVAASPDAFKAAGLEYNPAMSGLQATLQRRANGRAYIRLSSDRPINDPFVDMILEASWATGRIVRDYTMLFDPPGMRQAAPAAPSPAQIPAPPPVSRATTPAPAAPVSPAATATRPAEPTRNAVSTPARPAVVAQAPRPETGQVTVKSGDTASKIANATKPANVSLDQMLVALLRANPAAFVGDNVNRVKAGAIINVPTEEQAGATPAVEATQIIVAQSKDFNDYRRKLAGSAPSAAVAAADRKASGSVQATVEDKKPATTAPDKLTLSKGAVQGRPTEDQLAKERSAKEAASRAAEIAKNISDLSKLGAASSAVAPGLPASATAPAQPGPAVVAAAVTPPVAASSAPSEPASAAVSAPVSASAQTASAPAPAASVAAKPPVAVAVPVSEPGLVDGLIENPLMPAGAVGLIALLAGFGFYRARQRKNASQVDSAFLESRLQPDSFFGASGGQSVDTSDSAATGSSMVYSPSQLDAVDDVDPVAEADVYLAYGRDLQAEEILKDALRTNPGRVAIHQKLLEIFAKRRDTKGFEEIATLAFKVTNGGGSDWERVCELGLSIDPGNALYQPGGQPNNPDGTPSQPAPLEYASTLTDSVDTGVTQPHVLASAGPVDLDLDLDFSLDDEPTSAISETTASSAEPELPAFDLDFGLDTEAIEPFEAAPAAATDALEFSLPDLEIAEDSPSRPAASSEEFKQQAATSFGATSPVPLDLSEPEEAPAPEMGMLEFDLGDLSLDLGDTPEPETSTAPSTHEDPLVTKLALAEEFKAIGDDDGARALIEEVISEASGDMKIKAQRALSYL